MAGIFSYAKTLWQDGVTAITAARLNHIEQGISDAADSIKTLGDSVSRASGDCYSNNMNDIIKPGVYHVGTNVTLNKPSGAYGWGFLLVFASKADHTLQLYVPDGKTGKAYWRSLWEGESGPWVSVSGNVLTSALASQTSPELS